MAAEKDTLWNYRNDVQLDPETDRNITAIGIVKKCFHQSPYVLAFIKQLEEERVRIYGHR